MVWDPFDPIRNQRQYRTSMITRSARNIQRQWRRLVLRRRKDPGPMDLRRVIRSGPLGDLPSAILVYVWKWVSRLETIIRPPSLNDEAGIMRGSIDSSYLNSTQRGLNFWGTNRELMPEHYPHLRYNWRYNSFDS